MSHFAICSGGMRLSDLEPGSPSQQPTGTRGYVGSGIGRGYTMGSVLHSGSRGDNDTWGKPILLLCLGRGLKPNQLSRALRFGLPPALGFVGCVCV